MEPLSFAQLESIITKQFDSTVKSLQEIIRYATEESKEPTYVFFDKDARESNIFGLSKFVNL